MDYEHILGNLREARALLARVPEDRLNLNQFRQQQGCKTLMCSYGWLTTEARFRLLGLGFSEDGVPQYTRGDAYSERGQTVWKSMAAFQAMEEHFGPHCYIRLFCSRGASPLDEGGGRLSHQDLALHRFARQIEFVEWLYAQEAAARQVKGT